MRFQGKRNTGPWGRVGAVLPRVAAALAMSVLLGACTMQRDKGVKGWLVADLTA